MQAIDPRTYGIQPTSAGFEPRASQARITLTFGTYNQVTPWTDIQSSTWPALIDVVTRHRVGPKEGTCIVPATFRGTERKKDSADKIDVVFLDSDTGASLEQICKAIGEHGWSAAVSSTHSHLTTRTKVKLTDWNKFLDQADDPAVAAEQFLMRKKGYLGGVARGAHIAVQDQHYVTFEHQPCPKFRVVLLLQRPWRAADYPAQHDANAAWKERIEALAAALGLNHDQSCTDTSRLFYLPRRPVDGPPPETAVLDGIPCDIFALPEVVDTDRNSQRTSGFASGSNDAFAFTDLHGVEFDLHAWAKARGSRFEIVNALRSRGSDAFVGKVTDTYKHHIRCPNEEAHTQAGEDNATFCMNASASGNAGGFVIHCRHAHCTDRDRLLFLRQMLEQGWLSVDDLTDDEFLAPTHQANSNPASGKREFAALEIGSDAEIAERVIADLVSTYRHVVHDEGSFWRYGDGRWQAILFPELWQAVFKFDGARFRSPKGEPSSVKVGKGRVQSVLACMAALLHQEDYFARAAVGINCRSGFIQFSENGTPSLVPHSPNHRHRHVLPGRWPRVFAREEVQQSLLRRFLNGCFKDDRDGYLKSKLLAEVAGAAAVGCATRIIEPRAVILEGKSAENGKSQVLALLRGLLPTGAVSSISPARFSDETYLCKLSGSLLNAPDELAGSDAIASEIFKQVVTGDPVMARDVYRPSFTFQPQAQHIFATNVLPAFKGGMDRGVRRRLAVIPLNRVIPREERIERIGQRITEEEPDLVLHWAVRGAQRVLARKSFRIPATAAGALLEWIYASDAVLAWLESDQVEFAQNQFVPETPVGLAHRKFMHWACGQGFDDRRLPHVNGFSQRVEAAGRGVTKKRLSDGPRFVGLGCKGQDPGTGPRSRW